MAKKIKILKYPAAALFFAAAISLIIVSLSGEENKMSSTIRLPEPVTDGRVSIEEAINSRESARSFSTDALSLEDISQLLWAAGGMRVDAVTRHSRTYPSAGAIHPLEFYVAAGNVEGLDAGLYRYIPSEHALGAIETGDKRSGLARAALGQAFIGRAPASIIISADFDRVTPRYGERGKLRYVPMDAGHAGQNIYLIAVSRGLGTVAVGAFNDAEVSGVLDLPGNETPLYIYPIGRVTE